MKINIHTEQFIYPVNNKPARSTASPTPDSADDLSAASSGSGVNAALDNVSGTRAARVAQIAALYASGRYTVNSNLVAQALVSGATA